MKFNKIKLENVCDIYNQQIKPIENKNYVVYSLPAYDNGKRPEMLSGKDIMSNKLVVQNNTILFNKLNVKYKRIWNIHKLDQNNNICSTEYLPLIVKNGYNQDYIYYCLNTNELTEYLSNASKGTSTSHQRIDSKIFLNTYINIPEYNVQCKIANLLIRIDDKIELNNKINKNLAA